MKSTRSINLVQVSFLITLLAAGAFFSFASGAASAADKGKNVITSVSGARADDNLKITLSGTEAPTYTVYELFNPARIVVDLAESSVKEGQTLELPKEYGIQLTVSTISETNPPLTRFTFTLKDSVPFSVTQEENNVVLTLNTGKKQQEKQHDEVAVKEKTPAAQLTEISDINVITGPTETKVLLVSNGSFPSYTYDTLEKKGDTPPRLYIDVNDVSGDMLVKEQKVGTALASIRVAKRGTGLRFVFDSATDTLFPFQVRKVANGLEIQVQEPAVEKKTDDVAELIEQKTAIDSQLPTINPLEQVGDKGSSKSLAESMKDAFNFSGYNKERITVDFYKIDLHNVFRLLREVSKQNIVVDEGVSGSLTLALNDVPWDFALDIILNLKDLQKEERFNTIVILPKSKTFAWPERAEDNLSFEADDAVTEEEAILIQRQMSIPKTVIEAKEIIARAREEEKRENFETAVGLYEQAFEKWKDNAKLANKIAALYLVQLRQNAKALYFAKKALAVDPEFAGASLNAGIASANMQENDQAQQYFARSILGKKPSREALLSYAVFSEQQNRYAEAITLLNKYSELYGDSLQSMVARARILDKKGSHEDATKEYKKLLLSGFRIAPDLKKYIQGRIALSQPM